MGMTMMGEALTFAHDEKLLGFCLDDPDEPAGDDFNERIRQKLGCWVSIEEMHLVRSDEGDSSDEEGSGESYYDPDDGRTPYRLFIALSDLGQWDYLDRLRDLIAEETGIHRATYEPRDALLLECIEGDVPMELIVELAKREFEMWMRSLDTVNDRVGCMSRGPLDECDCGDHQSSRIPMPAKYLYEPRREDKDDKARGKAHPTRKQFNRRETIRKNSEKFMVPHLDARAYWAEQEAVRQRARRRLGLLDEEWCEATDHAWSDYLWDTYEEPWYPETYLDWLYWFGTRREYEEERFSCLGSRSRKRWW